MVDKLGFTAIFIMIHKKGSDDKKHASSVPDWVNYITNKSKACFIMFVVFLDLGISSNSYFLPCDYIVLTGLHLLTCLVPVPDK